MIDNFSGVIDRIGKEVGVDLGKEANVHHQRKLLGVEVAWFINGDALPFKLFLIHIKLGQNDIPLDKTAGRLQDQMAFAEMLFPEQAFLSPFQGPHVIFDIEHHRHLSACT